MIARAVIVPKLMFVTRHAWPTAELVKEADWRLRNVVWKSSFATPERVPPGWLQKDVAREDVKIGGLGAPYFDAELVAMAAKAVEKWAASTCKQQQVMGCLLQQMHPPEAQVVPGGIVSDVKVHRDLWTTGRPVLAAAMNHSDTETTKKEDSEAEVRRLLRHSNGLRTLWSGKGLHYEMGELAAGVMLDRKRSRAADRGTCITQSIGLLSYKQLRPRDAQGKERKWATYQGLLSGRKVKCIEDIVKIQYLKQGVITCIPVTWTLPLQSGQAHLFRELCLSLVAQFPELVFRQTDAPSLRVHHSLDDPHHTFWVEVVEEDAHIMHQWGSTVQRVWSSVDAVTPEAAVASHLGVDERKLWITPHPWLTKLRPLWAGKRRWSRTRQQYRKQITACRQKKAKEKQQEYFKHGTEQNERIATALEQLQWKRIQRMEGLTQYHRQNLIKLKAWKLRMWRGGKLGYKCASPICETGREGEQAHLIWDCPEAQAFWAVWKKAWWDTEDAGDSASKTEWTRGIFALRLDRLPRWLLDWGRGQAEAVWEVIHDVAASMWERGCAATITA
ncbi:hypothetical protein JG687_00011830 [Phytophthora cactorum]|uniref:Uncharacterized protein n=1 Tax=Phytophthora cactorum TaxID=29920 RepID=A0A8T1U605_9STRA|nr:hypothetical protein PC120_g10203 [Phytophthora cactorum]KAG3064551.1 hypothetical protein PC121_g11659 [Phytophthora cactorum]KAG4053507.1 hypothetical protein PC123_g11350 [Phytophthora cactorum]KAG6954421.1 hypothetical protein JG687_00011830 [Phytophthora cactorum]